MPTVDEIKSVGMFIAFLVWTLVTMSCATAIFRSFAAAELRWWRDRRNYRKDVRIQQLGWEVRHRLHYDPDLVAGNPQAAGRKLTDEEVLERRREAARLARGTIVQRAFRWSLTCYMCHTFWAALLLSALTRREAGAVCWVLTAFAYSGAAVVLNAIMANYGERMASSRGSQSACGSARGPER